jgi:nucleotide-binding universal stress UspA family protein
MYQKVLVPLDGSDLAECALSHVTSLAKEGSVGEIILLNIVKIDIPWAEMESMHPAINAEVTFLNFVKTDSPRADGGNRSLDINALRERLFAASRTYLAEAETRLRSDAIEGLRVKAEVLESKRPAYSITNYAQKNGMDLIVMATHGRTGLKKLLLGSVAFGVLNESHVPVLLIRPEACCL